MRVRTAPYGKIHASAVETAVVQGFEEGRRVQVVAVHPPDVVVEDSYGTTRHHGLRHGAVDDHPTLVFIVPGVPDDAAPCRRLSRRYRSRRRRGNAREDGDRVPDRLSTLCQGSQVRRVPLADGRLQHVGPDSIKHEEQSRPGAIYFSTRQSRLSLSLCADLGANLLNLGCRIWTGP